MGLSRTTKYAGELSGGSTGITRSGNTGALSLTAGALVLVKVGAVVSTGTTDTFAGDYSCTADNGLSFTFSHESDSNVAGVMTRAGFWYGIVPSTGNYTITVSSGTSTCYFIHAEVVQYTGNYDSIDPIGATGKFDSNSNNGNHDGPQPDIGGSPASLNAAPASTSYIEMVMVTDTDAGTSSMAPGTSTTPDWTESCDIDGGTYGNTHGQYITGQTTAAILQVGDIKETTTQVWSFAMAAVEIKESPGAQIRSFAETSNWFTTNDPPAVSISWQAGDKVVVAAATENGAFTLNVPTCTGLTFTEKGGLNGTASTAEAGIFVAEPTAAGSGSVDITNNGGNARMGFCVWVVADATYSTHATAFTNTAQSVTVAAKSLVCALVCDFNAATGGIADEAVTGSGTRTHRVDRVDASAYAVGAQDYVNTSAGTFSFGWTTTGRSCGQVLVRLDAVSGGEAPTTVLVPVLGRFTPGTSQSHSMLGS